MKRSEMVGKLQQYLYDATDCEFQIDNDEASLLLSFIEKAGMTPPSYPKYFNAKPTDFVFVNEWEPENE